MEELELVRPSVKFKEQFIEMCREFGSQSSIGGIGCMDADDFENSLKLAKDHVSGVNLPDKWVAASTYWLVLNGCLIGMCHLRHELNDFLERYGGHIGYSIRPSQRRNGYGTAILRLALVEAGKLGLKKVLVTCDDDNIASAKIIEKNGGKLHSKVKLDERSVPTRRYWIEI